MGKKRTKNIALARQVAMYLCRELTGNTYPHIGTAFSGRDHTTVMHACEKITKMMNDSDTFKEMIERLKEKILDAVSYTHLDVYKRQALGRRQPLLQGQRQHGVLQFSHAGSRTG